MGADWTDSRNVLGFVNHLRTVKQGERELPVYQSTYYFGSPVSAREDLDMPYFLILDEMNLSWQSAISQIFCRRWSGTMGVFSLHSEAWIYQKTSGATCVPPVIEYPDNAFRDRHRQLR